MGRLSAIPLALVAAGAMPACAAPVADWHPFVGEASARFGVPAAWITRVISAESGGQSTRAGRPITSRAGAMGLMQLMPATWATLRARLALGDDPFDPRDNILAGTFYLRLLFGRFGYPGLFAAYNAGPARYAAVLAGGARLPAETLRYLAAVAPARIAATPQARPSRRAGLFVLLGPPGAASRAPHVTGELSALFVISRGR